ncbi:MAG: hypothetical protein KC416_01780 [Myxococcales bacterium]|nr:hypothetical protein [Myxococcales bacterium]
MPFPRTFVSGLGVACLVACSADSDIPTDQERPVVEAGAPEDATAPRDATSPADASEPVIAPWPPPELAIGPTPQPTGVGWRTAQWNVCTTSMDGPRLECRARLSPEDGSRTAAAIERAAIAKYFVEDPNLYSFTLQEVCEQDARWIAAFVANGAPPLAGWNRDFNVHEYEKIDDHAPYAFLPYLTREMLGDRDLGCGQGVSTGIAVVAKRVKGTSGLKFLGLTNATYSTRADTGFTAAHLRTPDVCGFFFEHQTSHGPDVSPTGPYESVSTFRSSGCVSEVVDSLRGLACVRTRWSGPGDSGTYRVSTCSTHAVHLGSKTWTVRNHRLTANYSEASFRDPVL